MNKLRMIILDAKINAILKQDTNTQYDRLSYCLFTVHDTIWRHKFCLLEEELWNCLNLKRSLLFHLYFMVS